MAGSGGLKMWRMPENPRAGLTKAFFSNDAGFNSLCLNATGDRLAVTARNGSVFVSRLVQKPEIHRLASGSHLTNDAVAFLPDGRHVIFVGPEGAAEAWDTVLREKAFSLGNPGEFQYPITLSPDGSRFAGTSSSSGGMVIWDIPKCQRVVVLPTRQRAVWSLAFSPDDTKLAIGYSDGGLEVWNLPRLRTQLAAIGLDWTGADVARAGVEK
jgi:WD40 repeat protein